MNRLEFDAGYRYEESPAGIQVPVRLEQAGRSVELLARLDTGAADCIFDYSYAEILGLPHRGVERTYRTVTGLFLAQGHDIMIETLGLRWSALVFFHSMGNPAHAFLSRRGWLDQVRVGIVHRDHQLALGR